MIADLNPYPTYKDSGVPWLGEVPQHWDLRRLRDSVDGCINGTWGSEPNGREDLPCVRVADFDRRRLRVRLTKPTIRAIAQSERRYRMLEKGNLLLEKSGGGDLQPVGVVVLFDHDEPAVCSNFIARVPVVAGFDSGYLTYLHAFLYAIRLNVRSIKQTTGIQNLDSSAYLSETIGFPPFSEQAAIVRFLDHIDRRIRRYINAKQKLIKLLEEQKQAIIHRAVTRGLDPNVRLQSLGSAPAFQVNGHWRISRLWQLVRIKSEKNRPELSLLSIFLGRGVIPYNEGGGQVHKPSIDLSGYQVVSPGDLVLNNQQAWRGSVGVSKFHGIISPAYLVLSLSDVFDPCFANYLFQSRVMVAQYVTSSKGVGDIQRDIHTPWLLNVRVSIPPRDNQTNIATFLEKELAEISSQLLLLEREISFLREYRIRLIADVVTGKIDVREAAARLPDEPEEQESFDEADALNDADKEAPDDLDATSGEVEA